MWALATDTSPVPTSKLSVNHWSLDLSSATPQLCDLGRSLTSLDLHFFIYTVDHPAVPVLMPLAS